PLPERSLVVFVVQFVVLPSKGQYAMRPLESALVLGVASEIDAYAENGVRRKSAATMPTNVDLFTLLFYQLLLSLPGFHALRVFPDLPFPALEKRLGFLELHHFRLFAVGDGDAVVALVGFRGLP